MYLILLVKLLCFLLEIPLLLGHCEFPSSDGVLDVLVPVQLLLPDIGLVHPSAEH